MAVSAPDIHGSCLLGDFPSIGPKSAPVPAFTPRPPPATHPNTPLETYIFPQGRARGMPARWGSSWASSPRATVPRRRSAASPLPAIASRRAVIARDARRPAPGLGDGPPGLAPLGVRLRSAPAGAWVRYRGVHAVDVLAELSDRHKSPLGLGTSGCWECVLPRGSGRDRRRMVDGILIYP